MNCLRKPGAFVLSSAILALAVPATAQPSSIELPYGVTPWTPVQQQPAPFQAPAVSLSASVWTPIGPAPLGTNPAFSYSGRITGIASHPTDPNTIYIAAAGGGVWKTINGGTNWTPLTDTQATLSMGAIAISPSNPSVIYAGTGEANNSGDSNYGRGILVSADGGSSWTFSAVPPGTPDRLTSSQLAVDPINSSVAYAAMSPFGNNAACCSIGATGIWKTTDKGASWTNKTPLNLASQAWTAVVVDPNNNQVLYAAVGTFFGSLGQGVYKSINGGDSWFMLNNFPTGAGRIALAVSKSNSQILYATASNPNSATSSFGSLYKIVRSDDGGSTFTDLTAGTPNYMGGQGWYDQWVAVDPSNSAVVYVAGQSLILRSTNSGASWTNIANLPHVDHHGVTFDANGKLLDGDDGGIYRLDNPTAPSWSDLNGDLNTIQFQGIGLHPTNPNVVIGGSQDNGTEIFTGNVSWTQTDGGDGGFAKFSATNGNRAYHQIPNASFGANFFRRSDDGGMTWTTKTASISVDVNVQNFYAPFVVDQRKGDRVLYGTNRIWETTDGGDTWNPIANIGIGGFSNNPNLFVTAIALAPSDPNTIYVAIPFSGPEVYVTTNHGASWTKQQVIPLGCRINDLQVDPQDPNTAYAVIRQFCSSGNVFRTRDGGVSWTNISGNLSSQPVWSLQIDPEGALFVGAEDGVYSSCDAGTTWKRLGTGLPNAQVFQLEFNSSLRILGAATHGRGAWELSPNAPAINPFTGQCQ